MRKKKYWPVDGKLTEANITLTEKGKGRRKYFTKEPMPRIASVGQSWNQRKNDIEIKMNSIGQKNKPIPHNGSAQISMLTPKHTLQ